jgi:DNA-nicking Smr family endonuclease
MASSTFFCRFHDEERKMKSGGEHRRTPRIRLPSREELALWRHATSDVERRKPPNVPVAEVSPEPPAPKPEAAAPNATPASVVPDFAPKAPRPAGLAPLAPLERRLKRRLSAGKAQVDDVIDLHGMTQAQAHRALNAFLWRSAEDGARLVLVITGKGASLSDEGGHMVERGVLRRNAPHWLRAPELRAIVLSVEEATRPHGGAGALYVRLRRRTPG